MKPYFISWFLNLLLLITIRVPILTLTLTLTLTLSGESNAWGSPLHGLQLLYRGDGPPLPMDGEVHREEKHEIFHTIQYVLVDSTRGVSR